MESYGLSAMCLNRFKGYLSNRFQYVDLKRVQSGINKTSCGVLQDSVLGPLFFVIHTNDPTNVCFLSEAFLFADDTSIPFLQCSDLDLRKT